MSGDLVSTVVAHRRDTASLCAYDGASGEETRRECVQGRAARVVVGCVHQFSPLASLVRYSRAAPRHGVVSAGGTRRARSETHSARQVLAASGKSMYICSPATERSPSRKRLSAIGSRITWNPPEKRSRRTSLSALLYFASRFFFFLLRLFPSARALKELIKNRMVSGSAGRELAPRYFSRLPPRPWNRGPIRRSRRLKRSLAYTRRARVYARVRGGQGARLMNRFACDRREIVTRETTASRSGVLETGSIKDAPSSSRERERASGVQVGGLEPLVVRGARAILASGLSMPARSTRGNDRGIATDRSGESQEVTDDEGATRRTRRAEKPRGAAGRSPENSQLTVEGTL